MKKLIFMFMFLNGFIFDVFPQEFIHGNPNIWFLNINRIQMNEKWSFTNEIHERTGNIFSKQGQFLLRPSVDFHANSNFEISFGYSYIHVWPYPPYNLPVQKTENNIWEQFLFKMEAGKWKIQNRMRQENRWCDHIDSQNNEFIKNGTDYANRFRYRMILIRDCKKLKNERIIFINFWDEIWINQDKRLRPVDFARNWLYLGVGLKFSTATNLQLGYLNQIDRTGSFSFIQSDVVQLTFQHNFSFEKVK